MNLGRFWPRILVAGLLALASAAPASAAEQWRVSDDQGRRDAAVTGGGGTALHVSCATQPPITAALYLIPATAFAGTVGQLYPVDFTVDEQKITLLMTLAQAKLLAYPVGDDRLLFAALNSVTKALGNGHTLTVKAAHLGWTEDFPLKGSSKALKDIFKGCQP